MVVTEREKFIVPIVAVGVHFFNYLYELDYQYYFYLKIKKRAMIDFPDMLDFGTCPVKFEIYIYLFYLINYELFSF